MHAAIGKTFSSSLTYDWAALVVDYVTILCSYFPFFHTKMIIFLKVSETDILQYLHDSLTH